MSPFVVKQVSTREEFGAVVPVVWQAMYSPLRPEYPWLHPTFGFTEEDRLSSIKRDADRRWEESCKHPGSYWIYVQDETTNEVVGAVEWQVYLKNPFPNGPVKLQCTWFPEGEARDFVTHLINQCYYARMNWMNRPYMSFSSMTVLPSMRGHGVGTLLLQWGLRRAEELDLEMFIEASNLGRDIYERYDFQALMDFVVNTHKRNASLEWSRYAQMYGPISCTLMWRPCPSDLKNGTVSSFWEVFRRYRE